MGITVAETTGTRAEETDSETETAGITVTGTTETRVEETDSATITAVDRITTVAGRIMTAVMEGVITEETAVMAASVYLNGLRKPRVVLMESNRSRRVPARGIRKRTTGISQADTARVQKKR